VASTGNDRISSHERGSSFGYNNLWWTCEASPFMRDFGWPVVFDATHSVPACRALGRARQAAKPQFIEPLSRAAVAAGVDAVFRRGSPSSERALSDRSERVAVGFAGAVCGVSCGGFTRPSRRPTRNRNFATLHRS